MLQLPTMQRNKIAPFAPPVRVLLSLLLPALGGMLLIGIVGAISGSPQAVDPAEQAGTSVLLAGAGVVSLLIGLFWYGLPALGLRGGRPLYAGIGFATLGWVAFFLARFFLVSSNEEIVVSPGFGSIFIYLFLFEALALQLWTFGLFFRSMADWRGPLTAAVTGGILFGLVGYVLFEEALVSSTSAVLYFLMWGIFYGLIRLRTGGILGIVIIQAMHSLTTWHILLPQEQPALQELQNLYLAAGLFYLIFIWRLWPREEEDYRV